MNSKNFSVNKMNVLHATLYLGMGGLESVIMDLCRKHNREILSLTVLCFDDCDPIYKHELENIGVKVIILKRTGRYDFMFFIRLVQLLKQLKIDVVHAHSGCVFNAVLCAKLACVPVSIVTEHGLPIYSDGSQMPVSLKTKIENYIINKFSKKIIAVSDEIHQSLLATYTNNKEQILTIVNGIDTDKFINKRNYNYKVLGAGLSSEKIIIGSVGRLVQIKNYNVLLSAFISLKKQNENLHLVLVGDGPELDSLEKKARTAGVLGSTTFCGVRHDIHKILPLFDVFVLPSVTEGTSISLLEAQSCGVPAVVTNVGGNPDIIRAGVNGFVVPVDSVDLLAAKIELLIKDLPLRRELSHNARKLILERYDIKVKVDQYEQLYADLLSVSCPPHV